MDRTSDGIVKDTHGKGLSLSARGSSVVTNPSGNAFGSLRDSGFVSTAGKSQLQQSPEQEVVQSPHTAREPCTQQSTRDVLGEGGGGGGESVDVWGGVIMGGI